MGVEGSAADAAVLPKIKIGSFIYSVFRDEIMEEIQRTATSGTLPYAEEPCRGEWPLADEGLLTWSSERRAALAVLHMQQGMV